MKYIKLLLLFLALNLNANNKQESSISKVIVYLNGAQITRTTNIEVPKGSSEFTFVGLSSKIDESSIQLSGLKNASVLSINFGINYLDKPLNTNEIELLKLSFEKLNDNIMIEENLILGLKEEIGLIQSNRHLGNDTENVTLDKVKEFSAYYRKRLTEINNSIYNSRKKINEYEKEKIKLKKQLQELNVTDKVETGEIKVKFNSEKSISLDLILKYNIKDAGWFPVYDLKAEKINAPLNLIYKAHVYQNSGINWDNTIITLSTSDPNINNVKPELNPKYLNILSRYSNYTPQKATQRYNYKFNPYVKTVSGVVLDGSGIPLPGVNVIINGTTTGTQTDFDGKYSLKVENGEQLNFSYIGMKSETLPIHSSVMNINLEEDAVALDEVVVMGYGSTRKKRSLGFAVTEVKSESIDNYEYRNANEIAQALSGKVSGVNITSSSGILGSSPNIRIRGISSIKKANNNLVIIDGVPHDSSKGLANLNAEDIASIDVLKGNAASSLYGSRARSGVIVINTKSKMTSTGNIIEEGIANIKFELKGTYAIKSNNDPTVIKVDEFNIDAEYEYFVAPIINENVFLTAKFDNLTSYNLLPAEASIYFEGIYAGKTPINPQIIQEKITVSLGVDANVIAKRTQSNDYKNKSLIGNTRVINKAYDLEIRNNKNTDISITLMDRIPISQNKEIKIDDIETGNADYDDKKGLLTWKLKIPSSEKSTDKISYTVKYPKSKRINL